MWGSTTASIATQGGRELNLNPYGERRMLRLHEIFTTETIISVLFRFC